MDSEPVSNSWLSRCLAVVLLALLPLVAVAANYTGEAPVASQAEGERAGALKVALARIVARQAGDESVVVRSDVAQAIAQASSRVLQYQYRRDPDGSQWLVAQFDAAMVEDLLQRLGLRGGVADAADAGPAIVRVWIAGVQSGSDYARMLGYLQRLPMVRGADPLEARGDGVLVRLTLAGDLSGLLDAIHGGGVLGVSNASPPLDDIDATLSVMP